MKTFIDVYITAPYNLSTDEARAKRARDIARIAAVLTRRGRLVFAPAVYIRQLSLYGGLHDWSNWDQWPREWLEHSKELLVLQYPNWTICKSLEDDIRFARAHKKLVTFRTPSS